MTKGLIAKGWASRRSLGWDSVLKGAALAASVVLSMVLVACGDDVVGPVDPVDPAEQPAVVSVGVTPGEAVLHRDDTLRLEATPRDAQGAPLSGRNVRWSSSDTTIAAVSGSGLVSARNIGDVVIRATVEGRWGEASLRIAERTEPNPNPNPNPRPVLSSLTPSSVPAGSPGVTIVLTGSDFVEDAQILWDGTPRPTQWISATELRLTLAASQLQVEMTVQIAVRHAGPGGGDSDPLAFRIGPVAVGRVSITPTTAAVPVDGVVAFEAKAYAADGSELFGRTFTWSSSSSGTASVDQSGVVTGHHVGEALITVASEGQTASARVSVIPPVAIVVVNPNTAAVLVNSTTQLQAATYSSSAILLTGRAVTWQSENPAIAQVDGQGVVRGISKGTTRIRAESEGKVGWGTIEVRQLADGPVQSYEFRGLFVSPPIMPPVGGTHWTDEQGVSHEATLFVSGGDLIVDSGNGRYEQAFLLDIVVLGRGIVGQTTWQDSGSYSYAWDGRMLFSSSSSDATFSATSSGFGELSVEQAIGTAPSLYYKWVVK